MATGYLRSGQSPGNRRFSGGTFSPRRFVAVPPAAASVPLSDTAVGLFQCHESFVALSGRVDTRNPVAVESADYHCSPVGSPFHGPSALSRHTLCNVACQALSRHLCRDPQVRTGHPNDRRRFRRGYLAGVWERLLTAVAAPHADLSRVHLDSSHVRGHVRAVWKRRLWVAAGVATAPSGTSRSMPPPAALHRRARGRTGDSGPPPPQDADRA